VPGGEGKTSLAKKSVPPTPRVARPLPSRPARRSRRGGSPRGW
jgi:hypothetical protein